MAALPTSIWSAGNPPAYRIDGVVEPVSGEPVLTHEAVEQMMAECMPKDKYEEYRENRRRRLRPAD